jgi:hypothetical protein
MTLHVCSYGFSHLVIPTTQASVELREPHRAGGWTTLCGQPIFIDIFGMRHAQTSSATAHC